MSEIATKNYPASAKVLVKGKNQSRTALGIANAYLLIHPDATVADLNEAFPSDKLGIGKFKMFLDEQGRTEFVANLKTHAANEDPEKSLKSNYFYEDDNFTLMLNLKNGSKVAVYQMWPSDKFSTLVEWVKQYDIYVSEFDQGARGQKGGFELEYLNNWKPVIIEKEVIKEVEKKHIPWWVWLLIAALVVVLILLLAKGCNKEPEQVVVTDTVTVTQVDTVYVQQLEEIEKNFNAAQFEQNKSDLNDDAKFVLHDLQKLMDRNPELKLRIVGHTSEEGDANFNQKLSEARAKAAVDFLISQGVDESRLQYEGKGSSEPLEPGNNEINRRTEFEVVE